MCGIAGLLYPGTLAPLDTSIQAMTDAINYRGPDAVGHLVDSSHGLALGHVRLAIVDLTATGAQPMWSHSGRYVISYNGEIYNSSDVRRQVDEQAGPIAWRGRSDTEVLIQAIETFGIEEALDLVNGMFAFALWDTAQKTLTLARDRFGEKPLYYWQKGQRFAFASELKAFHHAPGFEPVLNRSAIGAYLRFGFTPGAETLLENVRKLPPGHYAVVHDVLDGPLVSKPYWQKSAALFHKERPAVDLETAIDAVETTLTNAVSRQLVADVPVGAFLSAGVDSAIICALARHRLERPLLTFSMGFDEPEYDESEGARAIARHLGTDHHEHRVSAKDVLGLVEELPKMFDEPTGDTSVLPTRLLCEMARKHVTVAISGDGGDELFGGYNHYRWGPGILKRAETVPSWAAHPSASLASWIGAVARRRDVLKMGHLVAIPAGRDRRTLLNAALIDGDIAETDGNSWETLDDFVSDAEKLSLPHQLMALDIEALLPNDILNKVDRAAMSVSLETRAPYLDREVAELAWSLPLGLTAGGPTSKHILRQLLLRHIPGDLYTQPKRGFGIPLERLLRNELKSLVQDKLDWLKRHFADVVSPTIVDRYWDQHNKGIANWQREIWTLLTLSMFLRTHFPAGSK
jgi:asparagine synthase (glutamine-hydrolysing)